MIIRFLHILNGLVPLTEPGTMMIWNSKYIVRLSALTALTLAGELIGLPQIFTGPFINAMLILTTLIVNPIGGIILGCITPVIALLRGQLPSVLAPIIPFIMIGNGLFVLVFSYLRKKTSAKKNNPVLMRFGLSLFVAAFIKFSVLALAARLILPVFLGLNLPDKFIAAMTFPQLLTAIIGGIFAYCFYEILVRIGIVTVDPI